MVDFNQLFKTKMNQYGNKPNNPMSPKPPQDPATATDDTQIAPAALQGPKQSNASDGLYKTNSANPPSQAVPANVQEFFTKNPNVQEFFATNPEVFDQFTKLFQQS